MKETKYGTTPFWKRVTPDIHYGGYVLDTSTGTITYAP